MTISREKYKQVHDRASADSLHLISAKFLSQAQEHIRESREIVAEKRVKTPEDRAEFELANEWYKEMVPFLSGMDAAAKKKVEPPQVVQFNTAASPPQYTEQDFRSLEKAHENAFKHVYADVMNGVSRIYETMVIRALERATGLMVDKAEKEGTQLDETYCVKTAQRFLDRLEGLMVEFHDMVMPDADKQDPGNQNKGPGRRPGSGGPKF